MTRLRKMMLEELERRNYAQTTIDCYIQTIEDFACHFRRSPDQLTLGCPAPSCLSRTFARKLQSNQSRPVPRFALSAPSPLPRVFLIAATPLNLHRAFVTSGFLQTAVSNAPRRNAGRFPESGGARPIQH
jgi:hypothetical protein